MKIKRGSLFYTLLNADVDQTILPTSYDHDLSGVLFVTRLFVVGSKLRKILVKS